MQTITPSQENVYSRNNYQSIKKFRVHGSENSELKIFHDLLISHYYFCFQTI